MALKNIKIEEFIPLGRDNAVTRAHLVNVTGMDDRKVRAHIEGARRNGVVIINIQDGSGYFQPTIDDYELVKKQWQQEKKRAMKILKGNSTCAEWLNRCKGQMQWQTKC